MFYIPPKKYFKPQEIFPPHICQKYMDQNGNINPVIWRLMDDRALWTAVKLREQFGPMTVNDYLWGGKFENRGFRDPVTLIDIDYFRTTGDIIASWSSFTSQHCFGRGVDSSFKNILAEEVRLYIISHESKSDFKYITAIEKEVSWLHFDTRNFKIADQRFFIF